MKKKLPTRQTQDRLRDLLHKTGFKATPGRLKLLALLQKSGKPLSISTILKNLKYGEIDRATVYRALTALCDKGLIRRVDFQHGHVHYEFFEEIDHHHLICTSCGEVEDFHHCDFVALKKSALKYSRKFPVITGHSFELFGLCRQCSSKKQ